MNNNIEENLNNLRFVCKDCSDEKRAEFQKQFSLDVLKTIENLILQGRPPHLKVVFSKEQEKFFNPEINRHFFFNKFHEGYKGTTEHMWIMPGSIDFKEETICGILNNTPFEIDTLKLNDIVIVKFSDIEDMIYDEQ